MSSKQQRAKSALHLLTGVDIDEQDTRTNCECLSRVVSRCGIEFFKVDELVSPPYDMAHRIKRLGYSTLLPGSQMWPAGLVVCKLADNARKHIGAPISIRWFYRPPAVNSMVGGAKRSDHLSGCAMDLKFRPRGRFELRSPRARAEKLLRRYFDVDEFDISLGVGLTTIHLGAFSPLGKRQWTYRSLNRKDTP